MGDEGLVEELTRVIAAGRLEPYCTSNDLVRIALRAVDAHLATRALRPAREVAHEAMVASGYTEWSTRECGTVCGLMTAAIERDRAGGRR